MAGKRRLPTGEEQVENTKRRLNGTAGVIPRFRCPYRAGASKDKPVHSHCREEQTFPSIDKLNEHLTRVHSLKYWCLRCKRKFPILKDEDLRVLKRDHLSCEEKPWPKDKEEWVSQILMSEDQYNQWRVWNTMEVQRLLAEDTKKEKKSIWSWRKIYKSLYPDTLEFPSPFPDTVLGDTSMSSIGDQVPPTAITDDVATIPTILPIETEEQQVQNGHTVGGLKETAGNGISHLKTGTEAVFVSPYSLDVTAEQQRGREEVQLEAHWQENTAGPASMVFSTTSGTTDSWNLAPPKTPSYMQEDHLPAVSGTQSDFSLYCLEPDVYSTWDFLQEDGLHKPDEEESREPHESET
ncbi:Fc.00g026370.m01.CDS01 [Cosmosporella sp. VM-42]